MASFALEHLTFTYPGQTRPALSDLTLTIPEGAVTVLCGESGSGKSTLLRQLKTCLTPHGTVSGTVRLGDALLKGIPFAEQARRIGFVLQHPDDQIVTDKVFHELAFGLESLGCDEKTMRLCVAEMASYFGIADWFDRDVAALSGGQKQMLNLASVVVMRPDVLILDEPTSQLDPIAASTFLHTLRKLNEELGLTILLFFLLPTFLAGFIDPYIKSAAVHNLVESVIKLVIFFAYMILCSKQKDIYRVFQYHGAEHKTIFCYEAGLPLTVENCRIQPRHHPRCGTSFLFVVVVVSILVSSLVFSFVNWRNMWVRMALHLLLLIPIVGVTYEFNRYVGGHDNKVTRFLARPGLWLQNFTTNEPDDSMLEVAIRALELVIPEEKGKDAW